MGKITKSSIAKEAKNAGMSSKRISGIKKRFAQQRAKGRNKDPGPKLDRKVKPKSKKTVKVVTKNKAPTATQLRNKKSK